MFISQAFFKQNNVPQESRFNLKKNVEEEYRKWKSMTVEDDIITHFSMQGSPPLFLCLLWKMLLETDHINQIGFRCVPRVSVHLTRFVLMSALLLFPHIDIFFTLHQKCMLAYGSCSHLTSESRCRFALNESLPKSSLPNIFVSFFLVDKNFNIFTS